MEDRRLRGRFPIGLVGTEQNAFRMELYNAPFRKKADRTRIPILKLDAVNKWHTCEEKQQNEVALATILAFPANSIPFH